MLFCAIIGQKTGAFPVTIDDAQTVGELKEYIKAKNPHAMDSFDALNLTLFKVDIDISTDAAYRQAIEQISQITVAPSMEPLINPPASYRPNSLLLRERSKSL